MQRAKQHLGDSETASLQLERYLDDLIPNFRRKVGNHIFRDASLPKIKAKVEFPYDKPRCLCVVYDVLVLEGL
jgi:hypothetical protein